MIAIIFDCKFGIQMISLTDAVPPVSEIYAAQTDFMQTVSQDMISDGQIFADNIIHQINAISDELSHEHEFAKLQTFSPTCETVGYTVYGCRCGQREIADEVDVVDHNWSRWIITVEPTVKTTGEKVRACCWCELEETGIIERLVRGENHIGRLVISSVGINVGLFQQYGDEGGPIVDAWDSAALFNTSTGCTVIGDHNNQGFNAIKRIQVGDMAEIQYLDGNVDVYKCVAVVTGHNNGDYLTDDEGNRLYDVYPDKLVCYTCNDNWKNITVVVFDKV